MLTIHFHPESKTRTGEVLVDGPYDLVRTYLVEDMQTAVEARRKAGELRALGGDLSKRLGGGGNALSLAANGEVSKLSTQWEEPERTCELPTKWLIDALDRFASYCDRRQDTEASTQGIYQALVEIRNQQTGEWVSKDAASTFFPDEWAEADVVLAIEEAAANKTDIGTNGWEGTAKSGIRIRGYADTSGKVIAAFPLM